MCKQLPPFIVGALLMGFAVALSGDQTRPPHHQGALATNSRDTTSVAVAGHNGSAVAAAGRRAFVDPVTGNIVPNPRGAAAPAPGVNDPLSTSGEGLREVQGKARGGGIKLHLQGRFRSTITATTDAEGHITTRCRTESEPN